MFGENRLNIQYEYKHEASTDGYPVHLNLITAH